jgi:hypothetical protein
VASCGSTSSPEAAHTPRRCARDAEGSRRRVSSKCHVSSSGHGVRAAELLERRADGVLDLCIRQMHGTGAHGVCARLRVQRRRDCLVDELHAARNKLRSSHAVLRRLDVRRAEAGRRAVVRPQLRLHKWELREQRLLQRDMQWCMRRVLQHRNVHVVLGQSHVLRESWAASGACDANHNCIVQSCDSTHCINGGTCQAWTGPHAVRLRQLHDRRKRYLGHMRWDGLLTTRMCTELR